MRVLWLGHFTPYPARGGAPQRSFNLIREGGARAELHFVGLAQRAHQPGPAQVAEAERAIGTVCASAQVIDVRLRTTRSGKAWALARCLATGRSYNEMVLVGSRWAREIERAFARIRPDVVHVDSVMAVDLIPEGSRVPAVLTHHNIESDMMERRADLDRSPLRHLWRREARLLAEYERRTASRFAEHLVVSELDGERLHRLAPAATVTVIPNGVDASHFAARTAEPADVSFVFAGRMNWYPNESAMARFLAELWPAIRARLPGARLVIAGMNPPASLLSAASRDSSVRVTGFVEDIRGAITGALVYVCPILDGGGTRLKLLDAMSLAMPIVATPVAAEGLDVADGREMIIRDFGERFVDAAVVCAGDPAVRAAIGSGARRRIETTYDWPIIGRDLAAARDRAAASGASSPQC